jgi:hypothetical protein
MHETKKYKSIEEFWPYYLSEHQNPTNRKLHFIGSAGALFWIFSSIYRKKPSLLLLALLNGYGGAWIGHFAFEKNKPATFKHPLKSFICDWLMFAAILTGKIDQEMEKVNSLNQTNENN